jgi:glutamine amidotransferase
MRDAIRAGLPTIGVCLGMQLLFDRSDESEGEGLGVITGGVKRLSARRVPQIGWNAVDAADAVADPLLSAAPIAMAYYANSFACRPIDPGVVIAWSTHEQDRYPAAVRVGNAVGVQFHPEKSSEPGVRLIHEFLRQARSNGDLR